ncbi:hypothetical protein cyc_00418 [Cyclospora cayetanensis]|uniref:MIF4G domain-containing protein n=1 Tax=Cyclospora cayetanensis TaxID=88456 RepID=A0A1D3D3E9_9EIME|nr:hypothetical protein cyc_00418 [Cyclospora cayetanensis]
MNNGLGSGVFGAARRQGPCAVNTPAGGGGTNSTNTSAFRSSKTPGDTDAGAGDGRLSAAGGSAANNPLLWRGGSGATGGPRGPLSVGRGPPTDGYAKLSGFFGNRPPPPSREPAPAMRMPAASTFRVNRDFNPRERKRRTLNALLNKLTIDNFGVVCEKICIEEEQFESLEDLQLLADLLFNKAVSEPEYSEMYADLYQILRWRSPEFALPGEERRVNFHRTFVNRCQDEFEKLQGENVLVITEEERAECVDTDDEAKLLKKKKTRVLGNMRFIGELFLRRALSPKVLNDVVHSLVFSSKGDSFPDEHFIECLTELLTTIGYTMDLQDSSRGMMNEFIGKLQELQLRAGYCSRITFKIQDLLDLRQRHWTKKVFRDVAKSVAEIREDAKRDELMGGAIKVAQEGVFLTVGLRREMPYKGYLDEQRKLLDSRRAVAAAGDAAAGKTAAASKSIATTKTVVNSGSSSTPRPFTSGVGAYSPGVGVGVTAGGAPLAAASTAGAAEAAAGTPGSSGVACALDASLPPSEIPALKTEVDLLVFEFVLEEAPIEASVAEWRSLRLPVQQSAGQLAAVFTKALNESRASKAARYGTLLGRLAAEHLKLTGDVTVLMSYIRALVISQVADLAVDNPRAPQICSGAFGGLLCSEAWGPQAEQQITRKGVLLPVPESEALAVQICKGILTLVKSQTPDRVTRVRSLLEATLVASIPNCTAAAAASML